MPNSNYNPYADQSISQILRSIGTHLKYVKAEFEAEGTRSDELSLLKSIVTDSNSDLVIKIGGSSAFRDLIECATLETSFILVPMIETPEALSNFLIKRRNYIKTLKIYSEFSPVLINIETETAVNNLYKILSISTDFPELKGVVIGRTDLTQSMNLSRDQTNSERLFDCCSYILDSAKKFDLIVTLGGNITKNSYEFISKLTQKGLDAFETRKCCIHAGLYDQLMFNSIIDSSLHFERAILELLDSLSRITYGQKINRIQALTQRNQ